MFTVAAAVCACHAVAGRVRFTETRYIPTGWTQPVITYDQYGLRNFVPSIPSGFEKRQFGTFLAPDRLSVHYAGRVRVTTEEPVLFDVRVTDGIFIQVRQGEEFTVRKRQYQIVGTRDACLLMRCVTTGRTGRLSRRFWRPCGTDND